MFLIKMSPWPCRLQTRAKQERLDGNHLVTVATHSYMIGWNN
jgi:hypothetical protein